MDGLVEQAGLSAAHVVEYHVGLVDKAAKSIIIERFDICRWR